MQTDLQNQAPVAAADPNNAPPGHPGRQYQPPLPPGYPYGAPSHGMYPQPGMMPPGTVPGQYGWPPVAPTLPMPPPLLKSALLPTPGHAALSSTPQSYPGSSGLPPGFPPLPQEPPPSGPPPSWQPPNPSSSQAAPGTSSQQGVAATSQAPETKQAAVDESSTRVVVQNLSKSQGVDFLQDRLRNHFPKASSVVIPTTSGSGRAAGHAYLAFATEADAFSAVALQNGLMMDGHRLALEVERNIPEGGFAAHHAVTPCFRFYFRSLSCHRTERFDIAPSTDPWLVPWPSVLRQKIAVHRRSEVRRKARQGVPQLPRLRCPIGDVWKNGNGSAFSTRRARSSRGTLRTM